MERYFENIYGESISTLLIDIKKVFTYLVQLMK